MDRLDPLVAVFAENYSDVAVVDDREALEQFGCPDGAVVLRAIGRQQHPVHGPIYVQAVVWLDALLGDPELQASLRETFDDVLKAVLAEPSAAGLPRLKLTPKGRKALADARRKLADGD